MKTALSLLGEAPGTPIKLKPDWFVLTDGAAKAVPSLLDGKALDPEKVKVFIDHETPCGSEAHANVQKALIAFAVSRGCELFNGYGTSYQLMLDRFVKPGDVVAVCGGFGSIYGSAGAYAVRLSPEEMALALQSGETEHTVPERLALRLSGSLTGSASGKDAALTALPLLGDTEGKLLLVSGEGLETLSAADRAAFFQLLSAGGCDAALPGEAGDAPAASLDLSAVVPCVSEINDLSVIRPAAAMGEVHPTAVFIGGCSAGRIEDIRIAAAIARGRHVQRKVRTTLAFASTEVYVQAADEGLISVLMDAGVLVMNQGCSGCWARSQALADGKDLVLSAGSRFCPNCRGEGLVPTMLCSAATAMESAIRGYVCPANEEVLP